LSSRGLTVDSVADGSDGVHITPDSITISPQTLPTNNGAGLVRLEIRGDCCATGDDIFLLTAYRSSPNNDEAGVAQLYGNLSILDYASTSMDMLDMQPGVSTFGSTSQFFGVPYTGNYMKILGERAKPV